MPRAAAQARCVDFRTPTRSSVTRVLRFRSVCITFALSRGAAHRAGADGSSAVLGRSFIIPVVVGWVVFVLVLRIVQPELLGFVKRLQRHPELFVGAHRDGIEQSE